MTPFYFAETEGLRVILLDDEAKHCVRVMRFGKGDSVIGVDGNGRMHKAMIDEIRKDRVELVITETVENWGEHGLELSLAVSPLHKPDRLEWLVEKAVELGVTEIRPILCAHTVKKGFRADRMERIMVAGMKQCMRSRLPRLGEPVPLADLLEEDFDGLGLLGWCEAEKHLSQWEANMMEASTIRFLIGPEGDFSEEEVRAAESRGYAPVSFGPGRLRTETAGVHALSCFKLLRQY